MHNFLIALRVFDGKHIRATLFFDSNEVDLCIIIIRILFPIGLLAKIFDCEIFSFEKHGT